MSIQDLLNDINDGVVDLGQDQANLDTSLEGAKEVTPVVGNLKINLAKLDTSLIDKFNNLYRVCVLRKALSKVSKVDRSIAVEAMAALPNHNPINEAKLTSTPSAINKKILDEIVFTGKDEMPADLHTYLIETYTLFNDRFIDEIRTFLNFIVEYNDNLRTKINDKYKTSIVMFGNTSYNLLATDLNELHSLDDTQLEYPKYSGELRKRIKSILDSEFYTFKSGIRDLSGNDNSDYSVMGLSKDLSLLEVFLRGILQTVEEFVTVSKYYVDQNNTELTGAASDAVSSLQTAIASTENYNKITSFISEESNLLKTVSDYVSFID